MYFLKTLVVATLVASSSAATLFLRGSSLECTSARAQIVSAINEAGGNVLKIKDASVANAAKAGIVQATGGVGQIAKAIFSLHGASAANPSTVQAGLVVEAGLKATARALEKGDTSDPAVVAAQTLTQKAQEAGKNVVATC